MPAFIGGAYAEDLTGSLPANFINGELHTFTTAAQRIFVPSAGVFYTRGLLIRNNSNGQILAPVTQYKALHLNADISLRSGLEACAVIYVTDPNVTSITLEYHAVGGNYASTVANITQLIATVGLPSQNVPWAQIIGAPTQFAPAAHLHHSSQLFGLGEVLTSLEGLRAAMLLGDSAQFQAAYQYIDQAIAEKYATSGRPGAQGATSVRHGYQLQVGQGYTHTLQLSQIAHAGILTIFTSINPDLVLTPVNVYGQVYVNSQPMAADQSYLTQVQQWSIPVNAGTTPIVQFIITNTAGGDTAFMTSYLTYLFTPT